MRGFTCHRGTYPPPLLLRSVLRRKLSLSHRILANPATSFTPSNAPHPLPFKSLPITSRSSWTTCPYPSFTGEPTGRLLREASVPTMPQVAPIILSTPPGLHRLSQTRTPMLLPLHTGRLAPPPVCWLQAWGVVSSQCQHVMPSTLPGTGQVVGIYLLNK